MNSLECGFAADTVFGPSVATCRREFDFTILFEEAVLVILPASLFIILSIASLLSSRRKPKVVQPGHLHTVKLSVAIALAVVQIAVLIVQTRLAHKTTASIPSAVVSLIASIFIPLVSHFEHLKSRRPSSLLVSFLSLTCLFESARIRTYWLAGEVALAAPLSVALGIRLLALYFESRSKSRLLLTHNDEKIPAEVLAGPISRTVFHWLNKLMTSGYCGLLQPEDLSPIDDRLLSACLRSKFQGHRNRYRGSADASVKVNTHTAKGLIWLTLTALGRTWVGPILARLAVTAFTFVQPFLVDAALTYLEADYAVPVSYGYGLIGAAFLCYVGIAAATSWYWHQAYRCAVMIRGGLAVTIFEKLLRLPEDDKIESMATTLTVGDLQRIMTSTARGHEVWAGILETGLATWLLYRQLGPSCFVVLGVAAVSGLVSIQIVKKMGGSQQKWLAATQRRLMCTKQVLDNLKGIKMTSQGSMAYEMMNNFRMLEIEASSSFRQIMVISCFLSYCTLALSPPLIFGVYIGTAGSDYSFRVSNVFTSLVIIALVSAPLVQLFQLLPNLGASYGCFQRLHNFLSLEEKIDYRRHAFEEKARDSDSDSSASHSNIMSVRDASFGWNFDDKPILKDISFDVKKGTTVAILGSVGVGKTLLLKGLIGEAYKHGGEIALTPSATLAYCSQTAWLENVSAEQNLTQYGIEPAGSKVYRKLAADCMLDDLVRLPTFASGSIGSGGVMLSGGQRQRLALARALSTKSDILILDDVFSALDRRTRWHIAKMLFQRNSSASERTVIYTTHDEQIANLADEIYRIDESGHLSREPHQSAYASAEEQSLNSHDPAESSENISDNEEPAQTITETSASPATVDKQGAKQMLGDRTVYKVYFKSVGLLHSIIFFVGAMSWAVSFKFSDVWVKWWANASATGDNRLGYWLGVYAALGVLALVVLSAWSYHQQFKVISRSGKRLHGQLANTVLKAQFPVISQVDTGTTLNRFSQDLMFVDMQLPLDLFNTSSEFFIAIIQVVLIAAASLPALVVIPVVFVVLYMVQRFYLRTSKQLRLHEIEKKAALITKISEAGSGAGLSTIRAHGWSDITMTRFLEKLDRSQEPVYLLYAVQRWLQLVLNLIVAGLVVVVLGASVALKESNKISPGAVGVAFLNAATLGETMTQFIVSWTGLETSLGAIARIALFQRQTPVEDDAVSEEGSSQLADSLAIGGPSRGAIRFENVWATYNANTVSSIDTNAHPTSPSLDWSLQGVTLDIKPGERIAICGKTGSGKSTMHLALLRMVNIPVGSIFIDDVDHSNGNMSLETLRKGFYVISQDKLKGFGNLRQELDPSNTFSDQRIETVLRECGVLDIVLNNPGGLTANREACKFSAGEEQLLSVARVILDVERNSGTQGREGGIVLLDEITSSVDNETEERIEMLVRTRLGGRTLIAINHRLEAVQRYDRVVVLDDGRVADFGTPAEVMQRCELFRGVKELAII
ncbi:canalicular multispecific organic anion transporter 1 [Nemania sp. FL0916]|nr:canalicular multispecific organic anion transporter 1 [Nemania sp. FL0916]